MFRLADRWTEQELCYLLLVDRLHPQRSLDELHLEIQESHLNHHR